MIVLARQHEPDSGPDLSDLNDDQRLQISNRRQIVAAWRRMCSDFENGGKGKMEALAAFLFANQGLTKSTLYRWSAAVDRSDFLALLDKRSMPSRSPVETLSEQQKKRVKELYLVPQKPSVAVVYQIISHEEKQAGRTCPSIHTFRRFLKSIPAIQLDYYRLGEREWKRQHEPSIRRDFENYRSGQMWVGDFHEFDVFCRKSEHDPKIVRPLLSAFLDLRSRMCMGWRIGLAENQDAVLLAIRDGVEKHGPPQQVTIDNGKPYRALGVSGGRPSTKRKIEDEAYVRSVLEGLNVEVHFSIPYNPNGKHIERWFGTIEQQFCVMFKKSYCGPDKDDRFKNAWKFAREHPEQCPTVAELTEKFAAWLSAYHVTPHSGDGMNGLSPVEAFKAFDPIPKGVAPEGALDLLLMRPTKPVKVTKLGVKHNFVEYGSTDRRLQLMHGQEVVLRVDPQDAGFVVVCDLKGAPMFRAINNRLALNEVGQDHVREGMKAKHRAKRLAKEIYEGGLKPNLQDMVSLAIKAKFAAATPAEVAAATGTDDATPRTIQPIGGHFMEATERVSRQSSPSVTAERKTSFIDVGELVKDVREKPAPVAMSLHEALGDKLGQGFELGKDDWDDSE